MKQEPTYEELEQRIRSLEKERHEWRQCELPLKESEARYRALFEAGNDAIFMIKEDRFIECNLTTLKIFGCTTKDQILGQSPYRFSPQIQPDGTDSKKAAQEKIRQAMEGKPQFFEWRHIRYDGTPFDADVSLSRVQLRDDIYIQSIVRDITERKLAEEALHESNKRLGTLFRFVPYPLVVLTMDGKVTFLNPAFTEVFGWEFEELEGAMIPYILPGAESEIKNSMKKLVEERVAVRQETKRLTKDGRVLDVIVRAITYFQSGDEPFGILMIFRDITQERRLSRQNDAMLRISMALPNYPDLEELLDYISSEIKLLLGSQGALVVLHDEANRELFFMGVAHDDATTEKVAKKIRFPADGQSISSRVIKTGKPIIVYDTSKYPNYSNAIDNQLGHRTTNMVAVPLKSNEQIIGVLIALNKKEGEFDQKDIELLEVMGGTVALSVGNARYSEEIKKAYREVSSLNRAKGKAIKHLSHELKTPISILSASINILEKKLSKLSDKSWERTSERARRNLDRLVDVQYQAADIMESKSNKHYNTLTQLFDRSADELEALVAEELGEGAVIDRIRKKIEMHYAPKEKEPKIISLSEYVEDELKSVKPLFEHREVDLIIHLEKTPLIFIPPDSLQKIFVGLLKNATENTPDQGKLEIIVRKKGKGTELVLRDYGVGITKRNQNRIFEGFYTTQETMDYSSKRPFDFDAGGKGGDLLRMKVFSERYSFTINMKSVRCLHIPTDKDKCPGKISKCEFCRNSEDCHNFGGTSFSLFFPPAPK